MGFLFVFFEDIVAFFEHLVLPLSWAVFLSVTDDPVNDSAPIGALEFLHLYSKFFI